MVIYFSRNQILLRLLLPLLLAVGCVRETAVAEDAPQPRRELRGVWVATVANIDWPSKPGLPVAQQQAELVRILDRAQSLNFNAIIFQVRPAADALYRSSLEPWSPYLTGTMGKAPEPTYDPLEFAVQQAHQRGLELHAWFNPYRALHKSFQGTIAENHVSKTIPNAVKEYDGYLWLDPGNPAAARHSLDVIIDVVRRYDIDGVHLDDYFYPYPISDADKKEVPFPDVDSFTAAQTELSLEDWRRACVDDFIHKMYQEVKVTKRHVKVGISPFGIWRPGNPESIVGFDAYDKLYADSRKWLTNGWVDYFTPQLYWQIESSGQSYPKLLNWWIDQNKQGRLICPGNYASKVGRGGADSWPATEIVRQIEVTRQTQGASGNVLFSMKSLFDDHGPLGKALLEGPYRLPALVPESPWLSDSRPARPSLSRSKVANTSRLQLQMADQQSPWLWVVRQQRAGAWEIRIVPGQEQSLAIEDVENVIVSAINRTGQESPPASLSEGAPN